LDANKHLQQAEKNEQLATYLEGTSYLDWQCTAIFYAAVHYVQAYFMSRKPPTRSDNHAERGTLIQLDNQIAKIYDDYNGLQDSSEAARYYG
jgi:hypothetical protein